MLQVPPNIDTYLLTYLLHFTSMHPRRWLPLWQHLDVTSFPTVSWLPFISLCNASNTVLETIPASSLTVYNERAQISDEQVAAACAEFQGLSDIVLCSLPDALLQPLLGRLHVEGSRFMSQQQEPVSAKQWLWSADPALRSVVAKEALQWHRGMLSQVNRRKDTVSRCNAVQ
jgi:hypothetical protein